MRRLLATLAVSVLALLPAAAQGGRGPSPMERWHELSPERRAEMRARFEAWQDMSEAERAELRARHERLREAEGRVRGELDPEQRAELERMGPAERREFLREHLAHEFSRCGRRMAGLLPEDVRERLEAAGPDERMQMMRDLRGRFEEDKLARGLDALARRLDVPEVEREAYAALTPEARKQKLYELRRREIVERVERDGPPPWIAADEWQAMQSLDDREFCARLRRCRPEGRGEDDLRELWPLLRPDPAWFEGAETLSEAERRAEFDRRISERLLGWLEAHPQALPELDRAELRALPPRVQLQRIRDAWRDRQGPHRPGDERRRAR